MRPGLEITVELRPACAEGEHSEEGDDFTDRHGARSLPQLIAPVESDLSAQLLCRWSGGAKTSRATRSSSRSTCSTFALPNVVDTVSVFCASRPSRGPKTAGVVKEITIANDVPQRAW